MRLVPNTDTVPTSVNKYLLPHERQVISVHQHPAVLIRPIFEALVGLAIAGWLASAVADDKKTAILVILSCWCACCGKSSSGHSITSLLLLNGCCWLRVLSFTR